MTPDELLAYLEATATEKVARQMAVIALHESGYSFAQIAKALGLSKSRVHQIYQGV